MKLKQAGKDISEVEITNISRFGVWIYVDGHEYFMDYDQYPWFKEAKIKEIVDVRLIGTEHLHWPDLDVDLHLDSLKNPSLYPLVYRG